MHSDYGLPLPSLFHLQPHLSSLFLTIFSLHCVAFLFCDSQSLTKAVCVAMGFELLNGPLWAHSWRQHCLLSQILSAANRWALRVEARFSFISVAVRKYSDQTQFREETVSFSSQSQLTAGKSKQQEFEAAPQIYRRAGKKMNYACLRVLSHLSLLKLFANQRVAPATMCASSTLKAVKAFPHRHAHRLPSCR